MASDLLLGVWHKFREHDIEIPFPQRDLHLRSGTLPVSLHRPDGMRRRREGRRDAGRPGPGESRSPQNSASWSPAWPAA